MASVTRHDIELAWHVRRVEKGANLRASQVARFRAGATSPHALFRSLETAWQRIACGDSAGSIYEDIVLAHEVHQAFYMLMHDEEETFQVRLGPGEPVMLPGRHRRDMSTSSWIRAFWLARLLRDDEGLDWLCNVPPDVLREHTDTDEHTHLWAPALQALHLRADDVGARVAATVDAVNLYSMASGTSVDELVEAPREPDDVATQMRDWALYHSLPAYRTLASVLAGDAVGFNENLFAALRLHRAYWDHKKGRRNASALVALDLTGIAAVAFDRGMPVEVTSDYLPEYLFEGAFRYPPP